MADSTLKLRTVTLKHEAIKESVQKGGRLLTQMMMAAWFDRLVYEHQLSGAYILSTLACGCVRLDLVRQDGGFKASLEASRDRLGDNVVRLH